MSYQSQFVRTKKSETSQPLSVIVIGIALCLVGPLLPATATAVTATEAMKGSIDQLVRVLEDPELKNADRVTERRQQLQKIFNDRFSYEEMSKRSLGAHWNNLNETQRQKFVDLFRKILARSYTGSIARYSVE